MVGRSPRKREVDFGRISGSRKDTPGPSYSEAAQPIALPLTGQPISQDQEEEEEKANFESTALEARLKLATV